MFRMLLQHIMKLSQGEYVALERIENLLSKSNLIQQIFLEGDSAKTYLVAIIVPDPSFVANWAASKGSLKDKSYEELCKTKELHDAIMDEIKRIARINEVSFK